MQIDLKLLASAVVCCLPIGLAIAIIIRKRKEQKAYSCSPFKELQRRPAGEALRIKLEDFDEKINDAILWLLLFPVLMVCSLIAQHPKDWIMPLMIFIFTAGTSFFFGKRLLNLLERRANYRLGYEGERFVGEELSRLIVLGFEIYHDVPFEGFNIDHVLVGPRGVFIVETKTRRKPMDVDGKKVFRVQFDGQSLLWPKSTDSHGIHQAKNNAKTLATWLSSATGDSVRVTPILTLPGWLVERKAPSSEIYILNPKEIYQVCESYPEKISEPQLKRICHQLDQKCRIEVS
jgi:hypothetical protein